MCTVAIFLTTVLVTLTLISMVPKKHQQKHTKDLGVQRALLYKGIVSRVAKRLGVSPSFVSRVARGVGSSKRVVNALRAEIERIKSSLLGGRIG